MRPQDYARALYKYIDIETAPIQLEPILDARNIELREDDFAGIDGIAFKGPKYKLIVVNKNLPPERKRFTIAHELGHIVMPHRGGYQICYPGKNKRMEAAADRFAAELLMPEPLVRKLWSRYKDNTEYRASVMADIFAVSVSAMRIRIRRLGLR
ncbi:hypothetical protein DRQ36_03250 [bacterium]|nr:MAG: hypothetical protein DRQ36_03250 [bacterium]